MSAERCPCCDAGNVSDLSARVYDHKGVRIPRACGPFVGWWTHLTRWCWRRDHHAHYRCTACGALWINNTGHEGDAYQTGFSKGIEHAKKEMRP